MSNSNCLEGMACPKCGNSRKFRIVVTAWATLVDSGVVSFGDTEWDEKSRCICESCGFEGVAGQFHGSYLGGLMGFLKKDQDMSGLRVLLASRGNPDLGQDPDEPVYGCDTDRLFGNKDATMEILKAACSDFIRRNNLGYSQWAGGTVYQDGKPVGRFHFNGRYKAFSESESGSREG